MKLLVFIICLAYARAANEPISVNPDKGTGGAPSELQGTDLTARFCGTKDKECKGENTEEASFAPSADQCVSRCGRDVIALGAFFAPNKDCHCRRKRCATGELVDSPGGVDLYRLKHGESCPAGRPDYMDSLPKYSNAFCVIKGKACKGHDMYKKPWKLSPFLECLKKCAKIRSCVGVDYSDGQCAIKEYQCEDEELVDAPGTDNYMRLPVDVTTCAPNREIPDETVVPQTTSAPTEPPTQPPAPTQAGPQPTEAPACVDEIREEQRIDAGNVINVAKCGKRYAILSKTEAEAVCQKNGAVLASYAHLLEAWKAGMSVCRCGWLSNGKAQWPIVGTAAGGCGKSNAINDCPASAMGSWGGPGWNAFCLKESCKDEITAEQNIAGGRVLNIAKCGVRYLLTTKAEGAAICQAHGAVLATEAQLVEAWKAGMSVCHCGWLSDGQAKWPIVGTAGGGCGKSNAINDCPASSMGSWGGPGWNALCFEKGCADEIKAEQQIVGGIVMNIARCGKRYDLTRLEDADALCKKHGSVLASNSQLEDAWSAGLSVCRCGWLSNGQARWPIVGPAGSGCGTSNAINECPASAMGTWDGPGWNAFCFKESDVCTDKITKEQTIAGGTVMNIARCGLRYDVKTQAEAADVCEQHGAVLATSAQLDEAWKNGMSICRCGWLSDGSVKWPIVGVAGSGCGKSNAINDCPSWAMGTWGGPGWNVHCFKPCDDVRENSAVISDGVLFTLASCGQRYQMKTKEAAAAACQKNGAALASYDQLKTAWSGGYSVCRCGWLNDGQVKFPIVGTAQGGCGKSDTINDCPASFMGSWGGPGWNAHCISCVDAIREQHDVQGGVIMNIAACGKRYQLKTKAEAQAVCNRNGAVLATYAQLEAAWKSGFSVCRCGWLEDGQVKFPIVGHAVGGCGRSDFINDCGARYMGSWGGPGWNTFCFK